MIANRCPIKGPQFFSRQRCVANHGRFAITRAGTTSQLLKAFNVLPSKDSPNRFRTVHSIVVSTRQNGTVIQLTKVDSISKRIIKSRMPSIVTNPHRDGDVRAAVVQQRLLYERRNQAAELPKQIMSLAHEFRQTFCGSECDKIMDLLITQSHGRPQQYIDDMDLIIQTTLVIVLQLGIRPLTRRNDLSTLENNSPAAVIARAMLREFPELESSWIDDSLVQS